jgi:hypothetical protein
MLIHAALRAVTVKELLNKKDTGRLWKGTHDSHRGRARHRSTPTLVCFKFHNCVLRYGKEVSRQRSSVFAERARDEKVTHEKGSLGNELLRERGHGRRIRIGAFRGGFHGWS